MNENNKNGMEGFILMGVISAIMSVIQGVAQFQSQKQQNAYNLQQYEDWKAYNSPEQQMDRLEAAGLNKYMVSNVTNTMSQPFTAGIENQGDIFAGLSDAFQKMGQGSLQYHNAEANRQLTKEKNNIAFQTLDLKNKEYEIRYELAQQALEKGQYDIALKLLDIENKQYENMFQQESYSYRLDQQKQAVMRADVDIQYRKLLYEQVQQNMKWFDDIVRSQIAERYSNISYRQAYINYLNNLLKINQDRFGFDMNKFYTEHYTLSAWQEQQINQWLEKNQISKDYYDLADKKFFWSVLFGIHDRIVGDVTGLGKFDMDMTKFNQEQNSPF